MKKIVLKNTNEALELTDIDFPVLINGVPKVGASLFTVTMAVNLFLQGKKLLFFTAYPMAREEFMDQLAGTGREKDIFYLERPEDIEKASNYQVVIVKSGDVGLCLTVLKEMLSLSERIIFVKNIESILTQELFEAVKDYQLLVLSGNVGAVLFSDQIIKLLFATKFSFSVLKKYTGLMEGRVTGEVVVEGA